MKGKIIINSLLASSLIVSFYALVALGFWCALQVKADKPATPKVGAILVLALTR
ncbi:MAG: hypothetical protein U1F68_06845 [Gammaproteobacteria bacterium]